MRIGELAAAVGMDVETVRYYEKAGLLPPPERGDNNYRRYGDDALQRLRFIANCRALDMSLAEVRSLLDYIDDPHGNCAPIDAVVDEHLLHVRERIAALRLLERQLVQLQHACNHERPREACGIVLALSQEGDAHTPRPRGRGVHGV